MRRRTPDLTAVKFVQDFFSRPAGAPAAVRGRHLPATAATPPFCGHLTAPAGRVLAFDVQPEAIRSTRARLEQAMCPPSGTALSCGSHADLLQYVQPGTADAVMFNFGWLPGADHAVFSTAQSSIPALQAGAAGGAPRRHRERHPVQRGGHRLGRKQAVLRFLRALPLKVSPFWCVILPIWADTAPCPA